MRRIKDATIQFISLCARGKNRMPVLYKADGSGVDFEALVKASDNFDEVGELLAVVYSPENPDLDGDVASADVIRKMAHSFAREGKGVDIHHDGKALTHEQAFVAESFIIQKGDPRFADFKNEDDEPLDVTGGWGVVMKIDDPALRKAFRSGAWNGVSMFGPATVQPIAKATNTELLNQLVTAFKAAVQPDQHDDKEDDMTPEQLAAALEKNNASLATTVAAEIAKALKPAEPAKKEDAPVELKAPIFKGSRTNINDVRAHRKALAEFELAKAVDWNDPASIATYEEELAKSAGKKDDADGDGEESAELKKARADKRAADQRIAKLLKKSNAGDGDEADETDEAADLKKCQDASKNMANFINGKKAESA